MSDATATTITDPASHHERKEMSKISNTDAMAASSTTAKP
jgi:hypothetical protein